MSETNDENKLRLASTELNRRIALLEETLLEKERAMESLQDSEKRYRRLFECAKDGILILDAATGKVVDANPFLLQLLGYSFDALFGQHIWELGVFKDIAASKDAFKVLQDNEYIRYDDLPLETLVGKPIAVEFVSNVYLVDDSKVIQCNIRDNTEHKHAEESLAKLSYAVEQSPVSIAITNIQGEIEYVNPKFIQITGYSREEVIGRNPRTLKLWQMTADEYNHLWETISSGNTWKGEFHDNRKNGELFWEMATISPLKNRKGEITNFIAIKEDITEQKALESQLYHAQKMDAVSTLAGGIAHDFNNLLSVIIGFGTILEMRLDMDNPLRKNASHILSAADRAAGLTKSLLTFSREQPLDRKIVDLNDVIRTVEKLLLQVLREDIDCRVLLSEEKLTIFADSGQIDQILLNLATNARDAMPNGGGLTISSMIVAIDQQFIKAHGFGTIGNYAMLSVSDTGIGMDEAIRQKIFEPFFTTKEVGKGTGLGLSMVYGIAKQHNGFVTCSSEPGLGTTFNVYFPLHHGKFEQIATQDTILPAGGTETILLAEDEEIVRYLFRIILEGAGYRVIEAVNGKDAVQHFMDNRHDVALVLMDLIMPKMNGRDAYNAIQLVNPHIRVIFSSGYSADIINLQELSADGFEFIAKPVQPAELLKKVREVLDRT